MRVDGPKAAFFVGIRVVNEWDGIAISGMEACGVACVGERMWEE
jgi:hypothetical protein